MADPKNQPETKAQIQAISGTHVIIIGLLIFVSFAGWSLWLKRSRGARYNKFAQCLAAKQVKMYGLYWCSHCADQKKMFGTSFQYVPYIECGVKGSRQEAPECVQAHVKNFPTWDFSGVRHEGVMPMKDLAAQSGCDLPRF